MGFELHSDWIIYGSGVSSLVLAERLSAKGHRITLINPGKGWGGVFSGKKIGEHHFDIGMTNFEFEVFGIEPGASLHTYDPDRRNDSGRFAPRIKEYVSQFMDVHELPTPQMLVGDVFGPDMAIANRFEILGQLPERERIIRELKEICAVEADLHAKYKVLHPGKFLKATLKEASLANHGMTLHNLLIEPICRKVTGLSTDQIPALYHRSAWAPLFYPDTLLSQFSDCPQKLQPTPFHYPNADHFGVFVERILERVQTDPNVEILTNELAVSLDSSLPVRLKTTGGTVEGKKMVWGAPLNGLLALLNEPLLATSERKADLEVYFLRIREEGLSRRFSVMLDVGLDCPFYRVTDQSVCNRSMGAEARVIFECNSAFAGDAENRSSDFLKSWLPRYGMDPEKIISIERMSAVGALTIPSGLGCEDFILKRESVEARGMHVIGPAKTAIAPTFNDHIIHALNLAEESV